MPVVYVPVKLLSTPSMRITAPARPLVGSSASTLRMVPSLVTSGVSVNVTVTALLLPLGRATYWGPALSIWYPSGASSSTMEYVEASKPLIV